MVGPLELVAVRMTRCEMCGAGHEPTADSELVKQRREA